MGQGANKTKKYKSLKIQFFIMTISIIIILVSVLVYMISYQYGKLTVETMHHEAELLADALLSEMREDINAHDTQSIQKKIDSFINLREKNDIEINVIKLNGNASASVVASNNRSNLDDASEEELNNVLQTLQKQVSTYKIVRRESKRLSKVESELIAKSSKPNHFLLKSYRILKIDVPLYDGSQDWGSVNIVMSLKYLDIIQERVLAFASISLFIILVIIAIGLESISSKRLFNPIRLLGDHMLMFAKNSENCLPVPYVYNNEISHLFNAFIAMGNQLKEAEATNIEYQTKLEDLVEIRTNELHATQNATIICMAAIAETRDSETGSHIIRVQNYVKLISTNLLESGSYTDEINASFIELLYQSAPLHDVGKVGIQDRVLLKPGKLTETEFEEMKTHTLLGKKVLESAEQSLGKNTFLDIAQEIAVSHHEKWDGSGYPYGLKGNEIPLTGRIMAVADVYDALISKRVYKEAFDHETALTIINNDSGTHFDPLIVQAFLNVEHKIKTIADEYHDTPMIRVETEIG